MSYILEFKINGLPKMRNMDKGHWRTRHGHAIKWKRAVWTKAWPHKPSTPFATAKLTLTRHSSNEPDHDGLVSGFKHVIDGLVEAGIIINDKRENIGVPDYRWIRSRPKDGHITVKVEA